MSIEIKLSRSNRIYRPDELLEGKVIAKLNSGVSYQSIRVTIDGAVNLQVRGGSAGVIESFYGVIKPIRIIFHFLLSIKIRKKKVWKSFLKRTMEATLASRRNIHILECYNCYLMTVDVVRGYLHKPLTETMEFIVESEKDNLL